MAFFLPSFHWGPDYMLVQWAAGFVVLGLFYSLFLSKALGKLPSITFAYLSVNAAYCFALKQNRYSGNPNLQLYVSYGTLYWVYAMTMLSMVSVNAREFMGSVCRILPWYTLANALYVDYGWVTGTGRLPEGTGSSGFLDYAGCNGSLIAIGIPFLLHELLGRKPWLGAIGLPLSLLAIYVSLSSIPYGVLAIAVGTYFCHRYRVIGWPAVTAAVPIGVGLIAEGKYLFNDGYRFKAYKVFMGAWWEKANHWVGTGPGSFQVLGPVLQVEKNFMVDPTGKTHSFFWLWLHSDWPLQILFEAGWVGLGLVTATIGYGLKRLWTKQEEYASPIFAMACGLAAFAIFDYPVKYWVTAFLTAFAIGAAYL